MLSIYPIIALISSTLYIYYIKLYAINFETHNLLISIVLVLLTLFASYKIFLDKDNSVLLVTTCVKIIPIILLTLMSIFVFGEKFELFQGIGIVMILAGILLLV